GPGRASSYGSAASRTSKFPFAASVSLRSDDFEIVEPANTGVTASARPSAASSQTRPARERQCGFFTSPPIPRVISGRRNGAAADEGSTKSDDLYDVCY